jgi:uncharacterized protein YcaQ
MPLTTLALRRYAVARSLFDPTTLGRAVRRLGFVQADPIRAPARAQDLILLQRVRDYRAGDLERRYARLGIEEDYFINYGFLPRTHHALMHPRGGFAAWPAGQRRRVQDLVAFVRERGVVHPREVDAHFSHGRVSNDWGGSSNATTRLLDGLHYRGVLRVVRRDNGIRVYAVRAPCVPAGSPAERRARLDALVDVAVGQYAPLPAPSLSALVRRLRYGAPQWRRDLDAALARTAVRLPHARVDGIDWYWPAGERGPTARSAEPAGARLLTPFDPVVWDRRRFEHFWDWAYRFEAYTPPAQRKLGYYALPLLWRDAVVGWGNVALEGGELVARIGRVDGSAPGADLLRDVDAHGAKLAAFLGVASHRTVPLAR